MWHVLERFRLRVRAQIVIPVRSPRQYRVETPAAGYRRRARFRSSGELRGAQAALRLGVHRAAGDEFTYRMRRERSSVAGKISRAAATRAPS
jgi:hypothetical protein